MVQRVVVPNVDVVIPVRVAKKLGFVIGEKPNIKDLPKKGLCFLRKIRSPNPKETRFPFFRGVGSLSVSIEIVVIGSFFIEESISFVA